MRQRAMQDLPGVDLRGVRRAPEELLEGRLSQLEEGFRGYTLVPCGSCIPSRAAARRLLADRATSRSSDCYGADACAEQRSSTTSTRLAAVSRSRATLRKYADSRCNQSAASAYILADLSLSQTR